MPTPRRRVASRPTLPPERERPRCSVSLPRAWKVTPQPRPARTLASIPPRAPRSIRPMPPQRPRRAPLMSPDWRQRSGQRRRHCCCHKRTRTALPQAPAPAANFYPRKDVASSLPVRECGPADPRSCPASFRRAPRTPAPRRPLFAGDDDAECRRRQQKDCVAVEGLDLFGWVAGAPGFEPGITRPKPVALPLGHAPSAADANTRSRRPFLAIEPGRRNASPRPRRVLRGVGGIAIKPPSRSASECSAAW